MQPTPAGWPRLTTAIFYQDAAAAIDWLCEAFGFEVRLRIEHEGRIVHSELTYGEALVMISPAGATPDRPEHSWTASPKDVGGANTQSIGLFVDDADAHCAHAQAHGATIAEPPSTSDYGPGYWTDRTYQAIDLEGHRWWFMQRLRG